MYKYKSLDFYSGTRMPPLEFENIRQMVLRLPHRLTSLAYCPAGLAAPDIGYLCTNGVPGFFPPPSLRISSRIILGLPFKKAVFLQSISVWVGVQRSDGRLVFPVLCIVLWFRLSVFVRFDSRLASCFARRWALTPPYFAIRSFREICIY